MKRRPLLVGALLAFGSHVPATAQLRPLEPLPISAFAPAAPEVTIRLGAGVLTGQRASLAGTTGTLIEAGNLTAVWRTGRVVLELGGTAMRLFEDGSVFMEPAESVALGIGPHRRDVGDVRITTAVRLTPDRWRTVGFIRFGTRLPTTDDAIGLDRDRTDFVITAGGHRRQGAWSFGGEIGLGIHGTHHPRLEQSDVLIYSGAVARRMGWVAPEIILLGHFDGMPGAIRGNEELSEVRVGARAGGRAWVGAHWVRGLTSFSPAGGLLVTAGWSP